MSEHPHKEPQETSWNIVGVFMGVILLIVLLIIFFAPKPKPSGNDIYDSPSIAKIKSAKRLNLYDDSMMAQYVWSDLKFGCRPSDYQGVICCETNPVGSRQYQFIPHFSALSRMIGLRIQTLDDTVYDNWDTCLAAMNNLIMAVYNKYGAPTVVADSPAINRQSQGVDKPFLTWQVGDKTIIIGTGWDNNYQTHAFLYTYSKKWRKLELHQDSIITYAQKQVHKDDSAASMSNF